MLICAYGPRLALDAAILASGMPVIDGPAAVAPPEGTYGQIGDVNRPARRSGVRPGMDIGTALEACPSLLLLPEDPARMTAAWEDILTSLEGIGAAIESDRPGEAFFRAEPLAAMYGGDQAILRKVFLAVNGRALVGAGPTRLAAMTSVSPTVQGLRVITPADLEGHLEDLPVELLRGRISGAVESRMFETLERLGVRTLGRLKCLPPESMADRFGEPGLEALRVASGIEDPLHPRRPRSAVEVSLDLESVDGGDRLPAALDLICGMLASRLERKGLLARCLKLEVSLEAGGSLVRELVPRIPTRSSAIISLLVRGAIGTLPSLANVVSLRAPETTPALPGQDDLFGDPANDRRKRITEAARQVGVAVGDDALLRVVETDPASRLPERRVLMVPVTEADL